MTIATNQLRDTYRDRGHHDHRVHRDDRGHHVHRGHHDRRVHHDDRGHHDRHDHRDHHARLKCTMLNTFTHPDVIFCDKAIAPQSST